MWYYTTSHQLQKLLEGLDANEMEAPLVRELLEMKQEILRQMEVTENLTEQAKGNRKSYLEVEIANIKKQKEQRHLDPKNEIKLDEKHDSDMSLVNDTDIINEVTVTSDDIVRDENDDDVDNEDSKRIKNNCMSKGKVHIQKKSDDGKFFMSRRFINY